MCFKVWGSSWRSGDHFGCLGVILEVCRSFWEIYIFLSNASSFFFRMFLAGSGDRFGKYVKCFVAPFGCYTSVFFEEPPPIDFVQPFCEKIIRGLDGNCLTFVSSIVWCFSKVCFGDDFLWDDLLSCFGILWCCLFVLWAPLPVFCYSFGWLLLAWGVWGLPMGFVVGHWAPGRRFGVDLLCFLLFQKRREAFQMSLGFGLTMYLQRSSFKRASRSHAKTGLCGTFEISVLLAW